MDSNNCHIRPTPLQAAIYRRIFRCLYDRFLDCPLSFARLLENPTYAAIADRKFPDSNGQVYSLRQCTLVAGNGTIYALTESKRLPTDALTIFEPGREQAELTWCILQQDGARQRVAYVLSDKLEGSLNFMSADAQADGLQALFENERRDEILRLLTDDVFLADFTQTLGRYASTLFPQQESLLDFEAPVIDFFEYSDADAEHIVKAVLLAKSLGLLTVGKAELGDDPVRFQIPAVAAILAVPFLLDGTSRLLEREKSTEAIIVHRLFLWLDDILPLMSNEQIASLVRFLLEAPDVYRVLLQELALEHELPEDVLAACCLAFDGELSSPEVDLLLEKHPNSENVFHAITDAFRQSVFCEKPGLCMAAVVVQAAACQRTRIAPEALAQKLLFSENRAEQLLGACFLRYYAREKYTQDYHLNIARKHHGRVSAEVVSKLLECLTATPFCEHYVDAIFDMVLGGCISQQALQTIDLFRFAIQMAESEEFKAAGWKLLSLFPINTETMCWGKQYTGTALAAEAHRRFSEAADEPAAAALHFTAYILLSGFSVGEIYRRHIDLCVTYFHAKKPWSNEGAALLSMIVNDILQLPDVPSVHKRRAVCGELPRSYLPTPLHIARCQERYTLATALSSGSIDCNIVSQESELLEQLYFVRMVRDCPAQKYRSFRPGIAAQLLVKCKITLPVQSSFAIVSVFELHCLYGTPQSALAFYRRYREVLDRTERADTFVAGVPTWSDSRVGIAGYLEALLSIPRVGVGVLRAARAKKPEIAQALLREAAPLLNTPWCVIRLSEVFEGELLDELRALFPEQERYMSRCFAEGEMHRGQCADDSERCYFGSGTPDEEYLEKQCGRRIFSSRNAVLFYDDPGFLYTVMCRDSLAATTVLALGYDDDPVMLRLAIMCCGNILRYASARLRSDPDLQALAREVERERESTTQGAGLLSLLNQINEDEEGDLTRF